MKDQGYTSIAKDAGVKTDTFTFSEAQQMQRVVWDAAGSTKGFEAPSGNMIHVLVNLAAQSAIAEHKDKSK